MTPVLALHKIPLYNTGRLDDDDIIAAFSARHSLFERIVADLSAEKKESRAQHHLIVGQRGMGKTMLLARLAAEIRTGSMEETLIPLVFAEEQYAVDRLSKFWLNCLDSLADAHDHLGHKDTATKIDSLIEQLNHNLPAKIQDDGPFAQKALDTLLEACASIGRRPVLLVDNLQLVFERLSKEQQHVLREVLMRPGCPILIGASPSPPQESQDYGAAFYDHFKVHYLSPLGAGEMKALMLHLSDISGLPEVRNRIIKHPERLLTLRQLTGGNPRTAATLFFLYAEDFAPSVFGDLENLLDRMTPLYKARFEELSTQQQVIASSIANHWNPVTSRTLSETTGLPSSGISPQLDRLEKMGFIERVQLFGTASTGYQIAERFFNVWFLMRSASRRQRREVEFLTRFIENFYDSAERPKLAEIILSEKDLSPDRHVFAGALASTLDSKSSAADLERHAHLDALNQKAEATRRRLNDIIDFSSVPQATIAFSGIREKLKSLVPKESKVDPDQFANAVLGCRMIFIDDMRDQIISWSSPMKEEIFMTVMESIGIIQEVDQMRFGVQATEWLGKRISTGQIRNPLAIDDWTRSFDIATTRDQMKILIETVPEELRTKLPSGIIQKIVSQLQPDTDEPTENWAPWLRYLGEELGFIEHAECASDTVISRSPSSSVVWNDIGNTLGLIKNRWPDAENAYRKSIDLNPKFSIPWRNLGSLLAKQSDRIEEAEKSFLEAIRINESYEIAWGELGRLYMNLPLRFEESEKCYRKAIEINPQFKNAWVNLGFLLENQSDRLNDAEEAYRKALEIDPGFFDALKNLGNLLSKRLLRFEDAVKVYQEALSVTPYSASLWTKLGTILSENLKRYEEAEIAFTKAAEIDPDDPWKWNALGSLYCDHVQNFEKAKDAFERALELQPESESAVQNLIFLQRDFLGNNIEAKSLFSASPQLREPEFKDTYFLQEALFSSHENNWGIASEALNKALEQIPTGFPTSTTDDWMRASAVLLHLNYGQEFLDLIREKSYHLRLRPWYEALNALHLGDRGHLLDLAPEVRTISEVYYDQIEKRLIGLLSSTRRRPLKNKSKKRP